MKTITFLKPAIFLAALVPAAALVVGFYQNDLTANPVEYITHQTGWWALAFLVMSLTITPLRRFTGWNPLVRLRRMLGLFSFFYATLHMLTWVWLLNLLELPLMIEDVTQRPFITIGMAAFIILLALAATSHRFAVRALGRRWQTLHRLAYVAAIFGVLHFWWLVKSDITEPLRWAIGIAALLGVRVYWAWQKRRVRALDAVPTTR